MDLLTEVLTMLTGMRSKLMPYYQADGLPESSKQEHEKPPRQGRQ
jgi:hypothetical protein